VGGQGIMQARTNSLRGKRKRILDGVRRKVETEVSNLTVGSKLDAPFLDDQENQVWNLRSIGKQVLNQVHNQVVDQIWNQVWNQIWIQVNLTRRRKRNEQQ
jgi:hypothetical protein